LKSPEQLESLIREVYEHFNRGDRSIVERVCTPDYLERYKAETDDADAAIRAACPDWRWEVETIRDPDASAKLRALALSARS